MAKLKFISTFLSLVFLEYLLSIYEAGEGLYWPVSSEVYTLALNISGDLPKAILSTIVAVYLIPFPLPAGRADLIAGKTALIAYSTFLWVDVMQLILGGFDTLNWMEEAPFLLCLSVAIFFYVRFNSKWQLLKARLSRLFKW